MLFYGLTQFTPNSALLQNFKVHQKTNKYRDQNSLHEIAVKEVSFKWSLYTLNKISGEDSNVIWNYIFDYFSLNWYRCSNHR